MGDSARKGPQNEKVSPHPPSERWFSVLSQLSVAAEASPSSAQRRPASHRTLAEIFSNSPTGWANAPRLDTALAARDRSQRVGPQQTANTRMYMAARTHRTQAIVVRVRAVGALQAEEKPQERGLVKVERLDKPRLLEQRVAGAAQRVLSPRMQACKRVIKAVSC